MRIAILKEIEKDETRVAAIPETVKKLTTPEQHVVVEKGAGEAAGISDADFEAAGAEIAERKEALAEADLVLKVRPPTQDDLLDQHEVDLMGQGTALVAAFSPRTNGELVRKLAEGKISSFSMDEIPRITRAQSMDVLSSMSTIAGYKSVLLAAGQMSKMVPMMMTAAGTIRPSKALIIGAGVAGLQAIATAKRLGAQVKAVDVRPAVKEQVESLGAKFIPMEVEHEAEDVGGYAKDLGEEFYKGEQEILAPHVKEADLIVTTALIPGKPAPVLITEAMVQSMDPGSVIVDLAAIAGGNCTLSEHGKTVEAHGVKIIAPENIPATVSVHASQMYARNVMNFLAEFVKDGKIDMDMENEVVAGTLITHDGKIVHEPTRKALGLTEEEE
ncbi:MAG: Re/Si-specific NAD(P)(+) transhydrogenase subunit alpha [Phycisphaerae bacterium]